MLALFTDVEVVSVVQVYANTHQLRGSFVMMPQVAFTFSVVVCRTALGPFMQK
jgi:hypothetical protein